MTEIIQILEGFEIEVGGRKIHVVNVNGKWKKVVDPSKKFKGTNIIDVDGNTTELTSEERRALEEFLKRIGRELIEPSTMEKILSGLSREDKIFLLILFKTYGGDVDLLERLIELAKKGKSLDEILVDKHVLMTLGIGIVFKGAGTVFRNLISNIKALGPRFLLLIKSLFERFGESTIKRLLINISRMSRNAQKRILSFVNELDTRRVVEEISNWPLDALQGLDLVLRRKGNETAKNVIKRLDKHAPDVLGVLSKFEKTKGVDRIIVDLGSETHAGGATFVLTWANRNRKKIKAFEHEIRGTGSRVDVLLKDGSAIEFKLRDWENLQEYFDLDKIFSEETIKQLRRFKDIFGDKFKVIVNKPHDPDVEQKIREFFKRHGIKVEFFELP